MPPLGNRTELTGNVSAGSAGAVAASLSQLQTDYIDLVMFHHRAADISAEPLKMKPMKALPERPVPHPISPPRTMSSQCQHDGCFLRGEWRDKYLRLKVPSRRRRRRRSSRRRRRSRRFRANSASTPSFAGDEKTAAATRPCTKPAALCGAD